MIRGPARPTAATAALAAAAVLVTASAATGQTRSAEDRPPPLTSELLHGLELRTIGPAAMSGRIVDIAVVEKDPYVFYVASATGGLWKTTDNGVTFTPVFREQGTHSIGDVAVHQRDTSIVWVGTGERANRQSSSWGNGVYKSTDGGESWRHVGLEETRHIGRIRLHPTDPEIAYVAGMGHLWGPNEERGLYRTADGGETWEKILYIDENTGVVDVAMDPENPNILYAAAYQRRRRAYGFHGGGPGSGLWKSTDGGDTWTELTALAPDNGLPTGDIGRIGISIYRSDPRIVYVSIEQGRRYDASTAYEVREAGIYRSEDRGRTWTHMSDWNPRPMYASQIVVDPNDDQRIYMMNEFSYSDDGGKTFTDPPQSLHGDDRFLWVDPNDSRHIMKADDGGLGISYDRGEDWLYVTSLPVSQFYHVAVDMRDPYWVYGGLQDNGSWAGPNATYRSEGVLNGDWIKTGGGDGFLNLLVPREGPPILYNESQYLGLQRVNLLTGETQDLRPGDPHGHISERRNWAVWGTDKPTPLLGNAMEPANWDGAFLVSPHDPATIYAGSDELWKSTDRGRSWTSLGKLTTDVVRSELRIMGELPDSLTLSLDDGVPYYPGITEIAESPLSEGLLYVGTDDGNVQVSRDGGETWTEVSARIPGLPPASWISDIEPSSHDAATVYVSFDRHRADDYGNYLYRSIDYGRSWTSITSDLPAERVIHAVREDADNPALLYVGTELGFFVSINGGGHWVELNNNLPTVAVNDFVIHPRENDLVLGTHGRGIWILDDVSALQELSPDVLASEAHLFSMSDAEMIRYEGTKAHMGDMVFYGENPPAGAIIDYWLAETPDEIALSVHDGTGALVRTLEPTTEPGVNRVVWDLRHPDLAALPEPEDEDDEEEEEDDDERSGPSGPFVVPGEYSVRLAVNGTIRGERTFSVREDPRIQVEPDARRRWTVTLLDIAELYNGATGDLAGVRAAAARLEEREDPPEDIVEEVEEVRRLVDELRDRIRSLYRNVSDWTGPLTADQRSRLAYYIGLTERLRPRIQAVVEGRVAE